MFLRLSTAVCLLGLAFSLTGELVHFLTLLGESFDGNGDGFITTGELTAGAGKRYDTNNDSMTTAAEFLSRWNSDFPKQPTVGQSVFNGVDSNSDAVLTEPDYAHLLKGMDGDKDGSTSILEFTYAMGKGAYGDGKTIC